MSMTANTHHRAPRTGAQPASSLVLNGPLALSTVAASVLALVMLTGAIGVMSSVFSGSVHHRVTPDRAIASLVAQHDQRLSDFRMRFDDRSVFFKPAVKKVVIDDSKPRGPSTTTQTAPTTTRPGYRGPSVAWVIGRDVYFTAPVPTKTCKYWRLSVGQESNGLKVLSIDNLPGTVRVEHEGWEYDVNVFGEIADTESLFDVGDNEKGPLDGLIAVEGAR